MIVPEILEYSPEVVDVSHGSQNFRGPLIEATQFLHVAICKKLVRTKLLKKLKNLVL